MSFMLLEDFIEGGGFPLLDDPKFKVKRHQLIVATTHLLFNPKRGLIKLNQLQFLFREIQKLTESQQNSIPISERSSEQIHVSFSGH